ncbi:hypothetical protein AtNW77_Chr4g0305431 [Arabidopsis thaliana]|uniref:At4g27654 n=2 Tax=Arabidopsis TaxID=3701 RepID=Q3E9V5_ARATH|nr:uncharacterized protein AT4G27654 [Arabidopsis thaliana]ABF47120.1 At4g27654 [Arabidopsis thaliana]AEE85376.1 transmembrane protein [Arabidopsis thaliana]KAG7617574.1 hypothetical protein ISN45_At04g029200 [Arabidopsis thaliana x Arabidopsis arenosa]|eukprot:NP_567783.1 transmembrane protein [Arabidopsis thaliana]
METSLELVVSLYIVLLDHHRFRIFLLISSISDIRRLWIVFFFLFFTTFLIEFCFLHTFFKINLKSDS